MWNYESLMTMIMFNNCKHFYRKGLYGGNFYCKYNFETLKIFFCDKRITILSFPTDIFQMLARNSIG